MRSMDDFLIHPTILDHDSHQHLHMSLPTPDSMPAPPLDMGKARPAATKSESATLPTIDESAFQPWLTYTSDEEVVSPMDADRTGPSSRNASFSSDCSLPELLEDEDAHLEKHCGQAHTVVIQLAGRAKMVSMPKMVDIPRRSMCVSTAMEGRRPSIVIPPRRRSIGMATRARWSQDSQTSTSSSASSRHSASSATWHSPTSTAPSSLFDDFEDEPHTKHKSKRDSSSRHVDLVQAARTFSERPASPASPAAPMMHPRRASTCSEFAAPSIRKRSKLGSAFALHRIGKTFARRDSMIADGMESLKEPEAVRATSTHGVPQPKRYSSGRPKLVARGASERAPTITLPPFLE